MVQRKRLLIAPAIIVLSFVYYFVLASKQWTWVFVSGDSGDWLAAANIWMAPQPYGSPLYIVLGHLINMLPGSLVDNMTILLSVLPAAITVGLVYLIVYKMTENARIGIVCAVVMLGASIPLSQATVLEEYSLCVMFVVMAFYMYLLDKKWAGGFEPRIWQRRFILSPCR